MMTRETAMGAMTASKASSPPIRLAAGWMSTIGRAWNNLPWMLRSILTGVLMGFSFPPFDLPILQIPAWMGLISLIHPDTSDRGVFRSLYPAMLAWNLVATYWLMMATPAGGVAANLANALVMTVPFSGIKAVLRRRWGVLATSVAVAAIWTGFEFFHHRWDLSWPWLTLANAWSAWPQLIQWISWTGHLGISFWVVLIATLAGSGGSPAIAGPEADGRIGRRIQGWHAALALGIALPLCSLAMLSGGHGPANAHAGQSAGVSRNMDMESRGMTAAGLTLTVIQPDQNSLLPNGGHGSLDGLLDELISQTEAAITSETDLVIWPENALDGVIHLQSDVAERLQEAVNRWDASLITGAVFLESYPYGTAPALARGLDERRKFNIYNSAIHLTPEPGGGVEDVDGGGGRKDGYGPDGAQGADTSDASEKRVYKKANLVPVVERFPFVDILSRLPLLRRIEWVRFMGYGKGDRANAFEIGSGIAIPTLICYDSVYPDWIRRFPLASAGLLVVITNDGWWGDTSGHTQHFDYARLRAIEFGKVVVRSANNGISGVILPDGSVERRTEYASRAAFTAFVPTSPGLTPYARYGNWLGWGCLAAALAGIALAFIDRRTRRRPARR